MRPSATAKAIKRSVPPKEKGTNHSGAEGFVSFFFLRPSTHTDHLSGAFTSLHRSTPERRSQQQVLPRIERAAGARPAAFEGRGAQQLDAAPGRPRWRSGSQTKKTHEV